MTHNNKNMNKCIGAKHKEYLQNQILDPQVQSPQHSLPKDWTGLHLKQFQQINYS